MVLAVVIFVPVVYMPIQLWTSLCYETYKEIAVVNAMHPGNFDVESVKGALKECSMDADPLKQLQRASTQKFSGGILMDDNATDVCRPNSTTIEDACLVLPPGAIQPEVYGFQAHRGYAHSTSS